MGALSHSYVGSTSVLPDLGNMKVGDGIFECAPIEASRSAGLINLSDLVTVVKTLCGHLVQVSAVCLHSLIWKCSGCIAACAYKLHIHFLCTMCTCVCILPRAPQIPPNFSYSEGTGQAEPP